MDQLLSVLAFTPCLASLAFCARSSGRAGHAAAIEISRVTYPLFSSAIERLSQLQEVVYTEYCRLFGGRFARIVLLAGAPRIQQLILQAPMLCKKLDEVLAHRTFPAVHTLELHDRAELDVPSDVFPAVKYLTVRSEHGSSAEFPSALVQSFKQTLVALVLDSVGCPPATPLLSLPNLHALEVNQAVPAVLTLFTRTPVVEIVVENATHVHVRILKDALRGSTGHLPFTRLAAVTFKPREGRRADRLRQAEAMDELLDICAGRGINIGIEELPSISFASSDG
ncbi:hypothetical protein EXIGLDRAFT_735279 [Exidia glandulosa HHB12029]|uniref:Uncharacterized protein n=1 Tax=Exidia glandulosa HHB12029 TaxID=1314781 RepID=A0A165Z4Q0_EXIGL|nr:hypothetical protein EXIGLDRAFT_735279 [Exidia glandulosa HHB12029]